MRGYRIASPHFNDVILIIPSVCPWSVYQKRIHHRVKAYYHSPLETKPLGRGFGFVSPNLTPLLSYQDDEDHRGFQYSPVSIGSASRRLDVFRRRYLSDVPTGKKSYVFG
jgi:hypothetical protein